MLEHAGTSQQTSTNPDVSYLRDVLRLQDGKTEEQLEHELRDEATMLGVDIAALTQQETRAQSSRTCPAEVSRRSQESVESKASQSTGLTSNFSDMSREQHQVNGPGRSRASLSIRDYDAFLARAAPNGRNSVSFSPATTPPQSTFSLPLSSPESSPKRHFRRIKGLSMLRFNRAGSATSLVDGCPHCPQDPSSRRRAVHKLPCGHRLCTQALRDIIKAATEGKKDTVPSCCGTPIPGNLVEHVMTQAEQSALLERIERWDEPASVAPSVISERRQFVTMPGPGTMSPSSRKSSGDSKVDSIATRPQHDLAMVMERSDFKQLRQTHVEQRDRFVAWLEKQRLDLEVKHESLRCQVKARHEAAIEELLEAHLAAMSDAEDKQVKAEADMRHAHVKERQDNATALKHMEAYCAGTYSTGEPHSRTITEQDKVELDKTRRTRDQMDTKQENAINVLRGEQSRRMKLRALRQDREVQELLKMQRMEELDQVRECSHDMHQLDDSVAEKRRSIRLRWQLQTAIVVKKSEHETGVSVRGRLPPMEWQQSTYLNSDGATRPGATDHERVGNITAAISTGIGVKGTT